MDGHGGEQRTEAAEHAVGDECVAPALARHAERIGEQRLASRDIQKQIARNAAPVLEQQLGDTALRVDPDLEGARRVAAHAATQGELAQPGAVRDGRQVIAVVGEPETLDGCIGQQHAILSRGHGGQREFFERHREAAVARDQPLRQEFLAVDACSDGTMRVKERGRVTGGIHEAAAQGERAARAGDDSCFVYAHACVQGLERRQRNAQVGRLRLGRQLDHGQVDARGTERVLHDAGGQPQRSIAPDDYQLTDRRMTDCVAHELIACLASPGSPQ